MRNTIFALIILLFTSSFGQNPVYYPMPDSNAFWNYHYWMYCFDNGTGDETYSITIDGDTLINSKLYHKLTTPYVNSRTSGYCSGSNLGYHGAFRQEVENRKVYFIPVGSSQEELLYDFNLLVGDTLKGYLTSMLLSDYPKTVLSIDSVLVDSKYHKRWTINTCYNFSIIEGIGSTYGLIQPSPGCITDAPDYTLLCFHQDNQIIYPSNIESCDHIAIDILDLTIAHMVNYEDERYVFINDTINVNVTLYSHCCGDFYGTVEYLDDSIIVNIIDTSKNICTCNANNIYSFNLINCDKNLYYLKVNYIDTHVGGSYVYSSNYILDKTLSSNKSNIDDNSELVIFPNPTSDKLNIQLQSQANIELLNINGQIIFSQTKTETNQTIDLSAYPQGIYFLKITGKDYAITKKIIKN